VVLVDEQDRPGGSWLAEPDGVARAHAAAAATRQRGVTIWSRSTAIAYYPEDLGAGTGDGPPGLLAVITPEGLVRLRARRYLYATGAYDQGLPFPDGDRPGILSARACGRLAFRWGVRPGRRVVIAAERGGPSPFAPVLAAGLARLGIPVVTATTDALPRLDLKRDLLAVDALPAPASELLRHHGARVQLDAERGGFVPETDGDGCAVAQVHAAGDVRGFRGPAAATEDGARVGAAVARTL
jgi:hypothetical protein